MVRDRIIPGLGLTAKEFKNIENFRKSRKSAVLTIMFTDIQGFTALTEKRGESYVHRLHEEHDRIVTDCVERNGAGIVIKYIGDSVMAIFSEPTAAVERALQIQKQIREFNRENPEYEDIQVRIGLHMGQTVLENKMHVDLFGRHVNKASRIESLADGGHILISYPVFDSVKSWLIEAEYAGYKHHGQYRLKGIDKPEDIYEVYNREITIPKTPKGTHSKTSRTITLGAAAAVFIFLLLAALFVLKSQPGAAGHPVETSSVESSPEPDQDKPAIAETRANTTAESKNEEPAAPRAEKTPEVFFISLNALEPILDLKTPLVLARVEGTDNTKKSLVPIQPGRHIVHFVVSDLVRYFHEFEVSAGENFLPVQFTRSELPSAQVNLFLQEEMRVQDTRTSKQDYFYYKEKTLEKVSLTGQVTLTVSGEKITADTTRFTIEYSLNLNGTEISRDSLIVDSPMNSTGSTRSEPVLIYEDPYHDYRIRYLYRNDSIQVNIDSSFKGNL